MQDFHDGRIGRLRENTEIGRRSVSKLAGQWADVAASLVEINRQARRARVLAVNASIEAAAAGAIGNFAIVAERMRILASSTLEAADTVGSLVATARKATERSRMELAAGLAIVSRLEANESAHAAPALQQVRDHGIASHHGIVAADEAARNAAAILERIVDVADDAVLLAINAALEAARAKQYGLAFAVIADDIGAMARAVEVATGMIVATLVDIRQRSARLHAASNVYTSTFADA